MIIKKYSAALLALSILLTGCGGASSQNENEVTVPSAAEDTEAEITDIHTLITSGNTVTAAVTSLTAAKADTATTGTAAAAQESQGTEKAAEVTYAQQLPTEAAPEIQPENDEQDINVPVNTEALSFEDAVTSTTAFVTTTTLLTATTIVTSLAQTTTTITASLLPKVVLDGLTLEQKVCQMFMVTPEALTGISPMTEVGSVTQKAIADYPVGGIIYFAKNMTSQEQMKKMISTTQEYAEGACGIGLFTAVDEEGGEVARCAQKLGTTRFESMAHYGVLNDSRTAYNIGSTIGKDLKGLGFNVDFAPVADVNICSANELGSRIFSDDPKIVANMASGVVKGLSDEGVCATLKHFPGLGAESGNTHTNSTVVIDRTVDELRKTEFIPFKDGIDAGADFVLVGHQIVTGFGDELPCDLSYKAVTEMLRKELGFEGIAITDSQQMNTISKVYSSGEAAKLSIKAGIDIILMPVDYRAAVDEVCRAVRSGEISEKRADESVMRILSEKIQLGLLKSKTTE
ncbi:MAG: hypothetical protein J6X56_02270 [Ruminococcus sp.]|nr:hypothetical protein [Ruminococcus sp.]